MNVKTMTTFLKNNVTPRSSYLNVIFNPDSRIANLQQRIIVPMSKSELKIRNLIFFLVCFVSIDHLYEVLSIYFVSAVVSSFTLVNVNTASYSKYTGTIFYNITRQ